MAELRTLVLFATLGFLVGIWFFSFFNLGFTFSFLVILSALALGFLAWWENSSKLILLFSIFFLGLALGTLRFEVSRLENRPPLSEGRIMKLSGEIKSEPEAREKSTRLILKTDFGEKVLVWADRHQTVSYGDRVLAIGKLKRVENFENEGKIVDYQKYLAAQGVRYEMSYPKISVTDSKSFSLPALLFKLKASFVKNLNERLPEPHSSLLAGLLLGSKTGLGEDLENNFKKAGVSHIVVLSGYNLSLVAKILEKVFSFLPFLWSVWAGVIGIILFTLMAGAPAAAVRAAIMAISMLLAQSYGRAYTAGAAILFAVVLMVFWNPYILVFDLGFQLSFLATIGIIYLTPLISDLLKKVSAKWGMRELLSSTLGAQIAVTPWILYKIGAFSVVALPANLLILPLVPLAMFSGFFTGLFSYLGFLASLPFAFVSYFFLHLIIFLSNWWGSLSFSALNFSHFSLILTLLLYFALFSWYLWQTRPQAAQKPLF